MAIFTTTTEEHICSSEAALPSPKSYNYLSITTATKRNETAERVTTQGFDRENNLEMGVAKDSRRRAITTPARYAARVGWDNFHS